MLLHYKAGKHDEALKSARGTAFQWLTGRILNLGV